VRAEATTRAYTDSVGRTVQVAFPPQRIVSLAPSVTEMLFGVGVEDQLIAVTDFCDYPEGARHKPKVGSMYHPNIERIVALQPDLVITAVGASRKETVLRLEALGLPIYVLNPKTMAEIFASITRVGELVARTETAQRIVSNLTERLAAVQRRLSDRRPVRTLYVLWYQPLITVGQGSFLHELITLAGGENLSKDAMLDYPTYSLEEVIAADPEVIVLNSDSAPLLRLLSQSPQRWAQVAAVRQQRLYVVDTGLLNRPGPRSVEAVELLARFFHAEAFIPHTPERR